MLNANLRPSMALNFKRYTIVAKNKDIVLQELSEAPVRLFSATLDQFFDNIGIHKEILIMTKFCNLFSFKVLLEDYSNPTLVRRIAVDTIESLLVLYTASDSIKDIDRYSSWVVELDRLLGSTQVYDRESVAELLTTARELRNLNSQYTKRKLRYTLSDYIHNRGNP